MSTVLVGALVSVWGDVGRGAPFILSADQLGSANDADGIACQMYPAAEALVDVAEDVVSMELTWGASTWFGPLTIAEAGRAVITFWDPARALDPLNVDNPAIVPGRLLRVDVDGSPAWTGKVSGVAHDLAAGLSTITGADAIPELSAWAVSIDLAAGLVTAQVEQLLSTSGWPADRWRIEGTSSVSRKAERYTGNLADGLRRLADAELGALFVDRTGGIVFRSRSEAHPETIVATLGDGGVGIVNLATETDRRLINRIVVDTGDITPARIFTDPTSVQMYGTSSLSQPGVDLNLT